MKHIPLENLRAFVTVTDLQSYTLAGEHLGRSQPAISLQIKRLEDQLGSTFVERHGNKMKLTAAGQDLYQAARQILGLHDQLLSRFTADSVSGQVRLGIPSEFATALLPRILGQFSSSYPQISLEVTSALSRDLRLGASRGQFDIILTVAEQAPADAVKVKEDALIWVAGRADYQWPQQLPLVVAAEGCIYRRRALQALKQHQNEHRIAYTNSDLTGISAALKSDLGITVLAKSSLPQDLVELKHSELPSLGTVGIYLERHTQRPNAAAEHLLAYLQDYLNPQN
ncbi:LysR family transcriptional regulator [Aliidiomarina haloalkalitolerans]|uniref:LysR family transcriptional regulator n=1 Tax=Aliidiomarina haloalkalitolerans TaxID=859059 RepID=A0A432VTP5_9GAMM|nr:LysR family transcriptional regulator [Aliidiomarina haloalkalitolerans]MCL4409452.1 LysR family transcriptional regulator [Gammaproteobacteria bacterium]RUO19884.1 LysR family transcriptional regulator [Aliidiomarina haloalkalitolerans]